MTHDIGLMVVAGLLGVVVGCSTPPPSTDAGSDAAVIADGGRDGGPLGVDAGLDAALDPDSGRDAGSDAGVDAGSDAGSDAGNDGGSDAGPTLPTIADVTPHAVTTSAVGHDRFYGVVFAPDSSFYVVGQHALGTTTTEDYSTVVAHFTAAGTIDATFGTAGIAIHNIQVGTNGELARGIALQSDGKIVVAATIEHPIPAMPTEIRDRDAAVIRLNTDGTLDATFGTAGRAIVDLSDGVLDGTAYRADSAWGIVVDTTNRIVVSGARVRTGNLDTDWALFRLTANGTLDTTFATGGVFGLDIENLPASARGVTLLPSGNIAASGYYDRPAVVGPPAMSALVRPVIYMVDTNGAPVTTFGTDGVYTETVLLRQCEVYGAALQGTDFVTAGYGRDVDAEDNDFVSIRVNSTTGVRDTTYGTGGRALLGGYDFGDNARFVFVLPDRSIVMLGQLRADATNQNAAMVVLTENGAFDTTWGTGGASTTDFGGNADHWWAGAVDPTGTRTVVVGIASDATTATTPNDDGAIWLMPTP